MVAAFDYPPKLTPTEYLAWEDQQAVRHEYISGEVYAMSGGTVNHGQLAANLTILLGNHLRGKGCRLLSSDVKVEIEKTRNYVYPDVSVTCDERDRSAVQFIRYPCLVAEVLSPSTEAYDRGDKFKLYRRSSSLSDYVLISTDKMEVDLYRRTEGDRWEIINYAAGDTLSLESMELTFPIEQLFEGILFED